MMETKNTSCKDMLLKLKHSFSLKSFSSTSYQSSLICNSKTIRLDVNLIDGLVLTSTKNFSVSNCTAISSGNISKKNREASIRDDQNLNSRNKNKSFQSSSFTKKSPKNEKIKKLSDTGEAQRSLAEAGKLNLKIPVKHSSQVKSRSLNPIQTRTKQNSSEFKSFRCDICMKYFSSKRNVKRHSILHSFERHACETCRKVFKTKENLKRHCRTIHEAQVKSISCCNCYKAFSRKLDLKNHLKKHPDHVQ